MKTEGSWSSDKDAFGSSPGPGAKVTDKLPRHSLRIGQKWEHEKAADTVRRVIAVRS